MADIHLRSASVEDAALLARTLRPADRDEVIATVGPDGIERAIVRSILLSTDAKAAEADGELVALLGVAPISLLGGIGAPWFLGTPRVDRLPGALTRGARRYLAEIMAADYPVLRNHVDARNVRSVRWLQRLGFTIHPAEPFGVAGLPFHLFEMRV